MVRLSPEMTYTTDAALQKAPVKRQCFTKDEYALTHFDIYTQENCIIDGFIEAVKDTCGCVGRHRGINYSTVQTMM